MLNTIKCTVLTLLRTPGIVVWSLAFPLIMLGIFSMMFSSLDDMADMDPVPLAAVRPAADTGTDAAADGMAAAKAEAFESLMDGVSTGDDRLFLLTWASSAQEAEALVRESLADEQPLLGYVELVDGAPVAHLRDSLSVHTMDLAEASILTTVLDEYAARTELAAQLLADDPAALADPRVAASLHASVQATEQVEVTHNQPKESVRYYFALMGMAALFGGSVGLVAVQRLRPNASALGARRAVSGLSHGKAMTVTLMACWLVNFACLTVAFLAMRFVVGIDFGGREGSCLAVTAAASLTALSLGCAVSAIPKLPESAKSGILTGVVCFASLFAGLYGQPTMELADMVAADAPWAAWVNPAAQIAQAFYSVMYYDSFAPMMAHVGTLLVMAAVLFLLAVGSLRRQRYASI